MLQTHNHTTSGCGQYTSVQVVLVDSRLPPSLTSLSNSLSIQHFTDVVVIFK